MENSIWAALGAASPPSSLHPRALPPRPPLSAMMRGLSWGPPPSTAATQLLRSERGGAAPPLASPPLRGGTLPPPPFAGEGARSAPPQAKVKSPSALLSFFN
nr:hypothetical protein [Morchella crassipes]